MFSDETMELSREVNPNYAKYMLELGLTDEVTLHHFLQAKYYQDNPMLHHMEADHVHFDYYPQENVYKARINLFGSARHTYIGSPLLSDTTYLMGMVEIKTDPATVLSKTARYSNLLSGLSRDNHRELMEYLKGVQSEREAREIINTSNTFKIAFKTDFTTRVCLK
jgi:hypothetical protein